MRRLVLGGWMVDDGGREMNARMLGSMLGS